MDTTIKIPDGTKCYEGKGKDTVVCPFENDGVSCSHPEVNSDFTWDTKDDSKHPKCPALRKKVGPPPIPPKSKDPGKPIVD